MMPYNHAQLRLLTQELVNLDIEFPDQASKTLVGIVDKLVDLVISIEERLPEDWDTRGNK